ncbi:hypothetical protein R5R35_006083 [Gryllus longicercus]|uniref:Cytochrome b5 heme-binding domain-containing protein n=1 Tax=Gryllus longicercus TaxID=2509291 RepID=A0AAN9Z7M8_9ORTH|nr:Cytochrome b5 [Gryllus bimaculatus]
MEDNLPTFNLSDVSKHKNKDSSWILIHGVVYDVTKYLNEHPGGSEILLEHAGKNATQDFESIGHSEEARSKMKEFAIGKICDADAQNSDKHERKKCHCEIM